MRKFLRELLEKRGYYIYKPTKVNGLTEFQIGDFSYETNILSANFSPWKNDTVFLEIYNKIKPNTLVDIYKCYELWKLVGEVTKISNDASIIEMGVWRGGTAGLLSSRYQIKKGTGKVYLADTFTGVVKAGVNDSLYKDNEHSDTSKEVVEELLGSLHVQNFEILQGIFPNDTASLIPNEIRFGLCHIDVDVYQSAKDCLTWVWDKLIVGGIVVFDDYGCYACDGITKLVEEEREKKDRLVIHNLNGHALLIKI